MNALLPKLQLDYTELGGVKVRRHFRIGDWLIEPNLNRLSGPKGTARLEPRVMDLLVCLASRAGEVVSREELLDRVWAGTFVADQALKVSVSELRKALGDDARDPRYIRTIPKRGYQLISPVTFEEGIELPAQPAPLIGKFTLAAAALSFALVAALITWVVAERSIFAPGEGGARQITSIAVLPLENLSADPAEDYFVDGLTEALIANLARIPKIRVISRTSVMRFKGVRKALPEIARELGVDAIIEGSVVRDGGRVRVTVQLVDATADTYLWSATYEREMRDVLALQSDMARDISGQVRAGLTRQTPAMQGAAPTVDPRAYEAYLKGRYFWNKRTDEALRRSVEYFEQAIGFDPGFAQAHAGLADTYTVLGFYSTAGVEDSYRRARDAAGRALELDDSLAEAHCSLAGIKHKYELDWAGAEAGFSRAIDLNPNYATARHWYAIYLQSRGEFDRALAQYEQARRLDPLSVVLRADQGWTLYTARRYDEAIDQLRQSLEMDSGFFASYFLILAYAQKGLLVEARGEAERYLTASGGSPTALSLLGYVAALSGDRRVALQSVEELRKRGINLPYQLALIYAALGEADRAIDQLEQIYNVRSSWLPFLNVEPELDPLRAHPRFQDLIRRIGLDPAVQLSRTDS